MSETKWSVNEALTQSYRSNMIASQSFLLAVGAIFFEKQIAIETTIFLIAIVQLWYIWFRIIRVRTLIIDYYKFNLQKLFSNTGELKIPEMPELTEEIYVKNPKIRKKVNNSLAKLKNSPQLRRNLRPTRLKVDVFMPITFTILWFFIIIISWINYLDC